MKQLDMYIFNATQPTYWASIEQHCIIHDEARMEGKMYLNFILK